MILSLQKKKKRSVIFPRIVTIVFFLSSSSSSRPPPWGERETKPFRRFQEYYLMLGPPCMSANLQICQSIPSVSHLSAFPTGAREIACVCLYKWLNSPCWWHNCGRSNYITPRFSSPPRPPHDSPTDLFFKIETLLCAYNIRNWPSDSMITMCPRHKKNNKMFIRFCALRSRQRTIAGLWWKISSNVGHQLVLFNDITLVKGDCYEVGLYWWWRHTVAGTRSLFR